MNKYLILVSVFMISLSSMAQENNRESFLIRQDRVWLCTSWERSEHTAKYMKFKESGDFMDKTYTRVSTIKKVIWDYGMTDIRIEDDIDETEAWMREEDGKVYLLLDGWDPFPYADISPSTGMYEGLLYDFNAKSGSTFDGIAQYRSYENDPGWYWEGSYHVSSIGTEAVGDEEVNVWNVRFSLMGQEELSTQVYPIVEGIGIVEYGCLFYAETFDHTSGGSNFYNIFNCCMDLDGNILYPKDYKEELPGGGLPSQVREVETEEVGQNVPIYDIIGRRILAPTPGQLYIQSGRKHIAR
ncbi:MAG: hypothetical protein K2H22_04315 [Muribaculaceae bacterium]|nr:hypothetical protein [Muribaculaceae bacterium]